MGTDLCSSLGSLTTELENAKRSLHKIDDDIKKIVQTSGRFQIDRNFQNPVDSPRGNQRSFSSNYFQENRNHEDDRQARKRPQETKTVFSRLSVRPAGDSDGEDEFPAKKPRVSSQVIRELPSKQQVLDAQAGDEVSKARNRRMFGSLIGTLQKFKQEEIVLKNKEDKKAQVEKKIEEQARKERENDRRERQNLFAERELKKATIKALEEKMVRLKQFEKWEKVHKPLLNFIETKWKPQIYWLPKVMNNQAKDKYEFSKKKQEKIINDKQEKLKEDLDAIEDRCRRGLKIPPALRSKTTSLSQSAEAPDDTVVDENIADPQDEQLEIHYKKIKQEDEESKKNNDYHSSKKLLTQVEIKQEGKKRDVNNGQVLAREKRDSHNSNEADSNSDSDAENESKIPEVESNQNDSNSPKHATNDENHSHDGDINCDKEDIQKEENVNGIPKPDNIEGIADNSEKAESDEENN